VLERGYIAAIRVKQRALKARNGYKGNTFESRTYERKLDRVVVFM
jgi:hypothetical protein